MSRACPKNNANRVQDAAKVNCPSSHGSFESDPDLAWVDEVLAGKLLVIFTLTQSLYNAMIGSRHEPGYRCNFHPGSMRGRFTVSGVPLRNPLPAIIGKGTVRIELKTIVSGLAVPLDLKPAPNPTVRHGSLSSGAAFVTPANVGVRILPNRNILTWQDSSLRDSFMI